MKSSLWQTKYRGNLIERGSSLKEVADLLRHRSLNSTLLYAKVDTPKLAVVALPWPGECSMSAHVSLQQRVADYLVERHRLGFVLRSRGTLLAGFARYVADRKHRGPLTADLMIEWARQDKWQRGKPSTWTARLAFVRHFARYLKLFEPDTEVPEELTFGPEPGRIAPHIFHDQEVIDLLAAARQLGPPGSIRPATYETLFGLRVSEALHLRDDDVDLKRGMLTIRQTKFAKSRLLPVHLTTVAALAKYRKTRVRHVAMAADMPFMISSRGQRLGKQLGDRQAHRVFNMLRDRLGWANRGGHAAIRLHDLRHYAEFRTMPGPGNGAAGVGRFASACPA